MGFLSKAAASVAALSAALLPAQVSADKPYHIDHFGFQDGDLGEAPVQRFHSSDIEAPVYQINYFNPEKVDTDTPYLFMAGRYRQWGPSIVSSKDLSLIWADQHYNGLAQIARTWDNFQGRRVMSSYSDGRVRVYDESYKQLYVCEPQGDLHGTFPDSHEAQLTHDDTVIMLVCPARPANLTGVGGPEDGMVTDCHIQEIDPDTNEVLFQWGSLEYFTPEDSVMDYNPDEDAWDFCHMNAIEKVRAIPHMWDSGAVTDWKRSPRPPTATTSLVTAILARSSWSTDKRERSCGLWAERRTCSRM